MTENWIVPCSMKFFDVINYFDNNELIVWRKVSAIHKDDIVYIYVGAPYSEIKFKCHVVNEMVDVETLKENAYAMPKDPYARKSKYIQLVLDYKYENGTLPLKELREHGLGQVQTQARTDRRLQAYINQIDESMNKQ